MHPQSGTTKGVLILCMVILGILLLPLPRSLSRRRDPRQVTWAGNSGQKFG